MALQDRRLAAKGQLLELLQSYSEDSPPDDPMPKAVKSNGPEPVTGSQLGAVLQMLEVRHQGLVQLIDERFRNLESLSRERHEQVEEARREIALALAGEVKRNDRRFNMIAGSVIVAFLAEIARFVFKS